MRAYRGTSVTASLTTMLFSLSFLLFIPLVSEAETRYVSDTLVLNLRDNIKSPFKVVGTVISEEPLTILDEKDDFLFVETEEGEKGWISAQYVKESKPKSEIIAELQSEITSLTESHNKSVQELDSLRQDIRDGVFAPEIAAATAEAERLRQVQQTLMSEKEALKKDYQNRIDRLTSELAEVKSSIEQEDRRLEELTAENSRLRKYHNIYWFCAGAAVFVSGIVTGKLVSRKKKRYMI